MKVIKEFLSIFLVYFFVFQPFFVANTSASDASSQLQLPNLKLSISDLLSYELQTTLYNKSLSPITAQILGYPSRTINLTTQDNILKNIVSSNSRTEARFSKQTSGSDVSAPFLNNTNTEKENENSLTATDDSDSLFQSAEADFNFENRNDAIAKYEKFVELYPDDPNTAKAHLRLAYLYEETDFYKATANLEKVVELVPHTPLSHEAMIMLARLTFLTSDYSKSFNILREVLHETRDWSTVKYTTYLMKVFNGLIHQMPGEKAMIPSCGYKALAEVLKIKGKKVSEIMAQKNLIVSLEDLKREAENRGVKALGVKFNIEQLKRLSNTPCIVHFTNNHFVVVKEIYDDWIEIIDPDKGETRLTKKEFNRKWSGYALVFPEKRHNIRASYVLDERQMEKILGGHDIHGQNLGGQGGNPNSEFDDHCVGGNSNVGMPSLSVNLSNLNLLAQDTDFIYSGMGPAVFLSRTYNADDPNEGIFGRSWWSNYEASLKENTGGDVDIKRESGKVDNFSSKGNGTYYPPRWVYDELTKNTDDTFDLVIKSTKITQHFDTQGRLVSIKDRNGNSITLQYDSNGLLTITDAVGRKTTFAYGANGKVLAVTDPLGRQAFYYYDSNNNLIKTTDMAGNEANYTYNEYSYMTSVITSKGTTEIKNVYYDSEFGYIVNSITDPIGNVKSYKSNSSVWVTDANGNTTSYYNKSPYGETTEITDPLGNKTVRGLDSYGNINSVKDPNSNTTSLTYDNRGNITSITDPLGNKVQFTYDANDNLTSLLDPQGNSYTYQYDGNDNLIKITDAEKGVTSFTYNAYGELTTLTDAKGNSINFTYDNKGNLTSATNPKGGTDVYTYDDIGRVISHTDPEGNTTSFTYDGISRLIKVTYPDKSVKTYTYDCCGLGSVTDKNGSISFVYDNAHRLITLTDVYGKTISYDYDKTGNLVILTYPDGKAVSYAYDAANRLIKATDWLNYETMYEYDSASNLIKTTYPDGSVITHQYDNASRLTNLLDYKITDAAVNAAFDYTLDSLGNRTTVSFYQPVISISATQDTNYTYDTDNRLLNAGNATFDYDNNGNLIKKASGNNVTTYAWDLNNMLTQYVDGGNTYNYKYDALGNRISITKNSVETRYIVDSSGALSTILAETDTSGKITAYYVYGLGLISKITPDGKAYYYHYDGIGSTIAITDSLGNIVNKYAYDAFGSVLKSEEQISNPFKYVGRFGVMDEGNGLLYMRARYYDPVVGRFINKDPIGLLGGLNVYTYARNNPSRFIDPSGLYVWPYTWQSWAQLISIYGGAGILVVSELSNPIGWAMLIGGLAWGFYDLWTSPENIRCDLERRGLLDPIRERIRLLDRPWNESFFD